MKRLPGLAALAIAAAVAGSLAGLATAAGSDGTIGCSDLVDAWQESSEVAIGDGYLEFGWHDHGDEAPAAGGPDEYRSPWASSDDHDHDHERSARLAYADTSCEQAGLDEFVALIQMQSSVIAAQDCALLIGKYHAAHAEAVALGVDADRSAVKLIDRENNSVVVDLDFIEPVALDCIADWPALGGQR